MCDIARGQLRLVNRRRGRQSSRAAGYMRNGGMYRRGRAVGADPGAAAGRRDQRSVFRTLPSSRIRRQPRPAQFPQLVRTGPRAARCRAGGASTGPQAGRRATPGMIGPGRGPGARPRYTGFGCPGFRRGCRCTRPRARGLHAAARWRWLTVAVLRDEHGRCRRERGNEQRDDDLHRGADSREPAADEVRRRTGGRARSGIRGSIGARTECGDGGVQADQLSRPGRRLGSRDHPADRVVLCTVTGEDLFRPLAPRPAPHVRDRPSPGSVTRRVRSWSRSRFARLRRPRCDATRIAPALLPATDPAVAASRPTTARSSTASA
jgi:hypothetical protein